MLQLGQVATIKVTTYSTAMGLLYDTIADSYRPTVSTVGQVQASSGKTVGKLISINVITSSK